MNLKKLNLLLLMLFSSTIPAGAQETGAVKKAFLSDFLIEDREVIPTLGVSFWANVFDSDKIDLECNFKYSNYSKHFLLGLHYCPTGGRQGLNLSASLGSELVSVGRSTKKVFLRGRVALGYVFSTSHYAGAIYEQGRGFSNYWYHFRYRVSVKQLQVGILGRSTSGWGPEIGMGFLHNLLCVTGAPLYDVRTKQITPTICLEWYWL